MTDESNEPGEEDELDEDQAEFFVCPHCGARELRFVRQRELSVTTETELECRCGDQDCAATRSESITTLEEDHGYVGRDRHPHSESTDTLEALAQEEDVEVHCQRCYNLFKKRPDMWTQTSREVEEDERPELTICCAGCEKEIEFGYSHDNLVGRLWLAEGDRAFNPWRTFPDPKYVERWGPRGWLRPPRTG